MSKKKKPKAKQPNPFGNRLDDEMSLVNGAALRVNNVIQKMTEPPETVLNHLKRIGIEPIIDKMALDDEEPKTYVVFDYDELVNKELEAIAKGDFRETYPKDKPFVRVPTATEPVVLDEIRRRMQEARDRHPSSQMSLEEVSEEDDWPIVGESPL